MSDEPNEVQRAGAGEEDYPVRQEDLARKAAEQSLFPFRPANPAEPPPEEKERFQFSLLELLAVITLASLLLGIVSCFPRPYAAGIAGLVALISLPVTMFTRFRSPVTILAWWVILGIYLITSLVAVATGAAWE